MIRPAFSPRGHSLLLLSLGAALAAMAGCSRPTPAGGAAENAPARDGVLVIGAAQIQAMGITTTPVAAAQSMPVGTVPGVISLPAEARVAVTPAYPGTVVRVLVMQGQEVRQGEALAVIRAAEPVQFGAALARARAEHAVAAANAARLGQLAREGIIAPARAEEARATLAAVSATVAENRRLLALGGAGRDGTMTLRAPIAGRVASVAAEVGGAVGNGGAPFIVENTRALRVDLQIPEQLAGKVRAGMTVMIVQEGRSVTGRLLSVGESLDPMTRAIAAKASLPPDSRFAPGKAVMVTIAGQQTAPGGAYRAQSGVVVPITAVTRGEAGDEVFVRTAAGFRRAPVTLAGQIGDKAYLLAGVKAGDSVATSGVTELKAMGQGR